VVAAGEDVILDWNEALCDVMVADVPFQDPGMASRSMAMVNLAMHDAVALTTPGFGASFYRHDAGALASSADREVAVASAAHAVLTGIYGGQQALLDQRLSDALAGVPAGAARDDAMALGRLIGERVVAIRENDGYRNESQYLPSDGPGRWRPDPLNPGQEAWGPGWGEVATFAVRDTSAFDPGPMPALGSAEYAAAFDEVRRLGSVDSAERTREQTEIGLFWAYDRVGMGTPMRLYNEAMAAVARGQGNTLEENAALFARASVAVADAGVVAWDSKFAYDLWRPVTGIREADTDGNPLTEADPDWTPLGAPDGEGMVLGDLLDVGFTPPFPTYLSGHATFGGAVFGAMMAFYGTDDIAFELTSEELEAYVDLGLVDSAMRSFESLSEAMIENGRSRVYLGIHWNFDDTRGQVVGRDIATSVFASPFVAIPEPAAVALAVPAGLLLRRRR